MRRVDDTSFAYATNKCLRREARHRASSARMHPPRLRCDASLSLRTSVRRLLSDLRIMLRFRRSRRYAIAGWASHVISPFAAQFYGLRCRGFVALHEFHWIANGTSAYTDGKWRAVTNANGPAVQELGSAVHRTTDCIGSLPGGCLC